MLLTDWESVSRCLNKTTEEKYARLLVLSLVSVVALYFSSAQCHTDVERVKLVSVSSILSAERLFNADLFFVCDHHLHHSIGFGHNSRANFKYFCHPSLVELSTVTQFIQIIHSFRNDLFWSYPPKLSVFDTIYWFFSSVQNCTIEIETGTRFIRSSQTPNWKRTW